MQNQDHEKTRAEQFRQVDLQRRQLTLAHMMAKWNQLDPQERQKVLGTIASHELSGVRAEYGIRRDNVRSAAVLEGLVSTILGRYAAPPERAYPTNDDKVLEDIGFTTTYGEEWNKMHVVRGQALATMEAMGIGIQELPQTVDPNDEEDIFGEIAARNYDVKEAFRSCVVRAVTFLKEDVSISTHYRHYPTLDSIPY